MIPVTVITPPEPLVSWEDAKAHLRLDSDDGQTLAEGYIAAASGHIDGPRGWLGRAIGAQVLEAVFDGFGRASLRLPYPPVIEVESVELRGTDGWSAMDARSYELAGDLLSAAWGSRWPSHSGPVRVRYRAGHETVPAAVRVAVLLMVGDLWRYRGTTAPGASMQAVPMSTTVEALLAPFRVFH